MCPKAAKKAAKKAPTANNVTCWTGDESVKLSTQRLKEMFVEMGQKTQIQEGQKPAERAAFRKQHGIVFGSFELKKGIPNQLKTGIFAKKRYDCAIRFSSDTSPSAPDINTTLGVGMKLFGVEGQKLIGEGNTADFIFQNIDRFFTRDAQQMCAFTTAGAIDGDYNAYLAKHKGVGDILNAMTKVEASCLSADYWAILPFKLGDNQAVKYRLIPEDDTNPGAPFMDTNYLGLDLQSRLRNGSSRFRFEIQLRTNDKTMPLDDAQVVWPESQSPFIHIATLILPQQDICAIGQAEFGSNLAFNIWRTLPTHQPLGSIAAARKVVYQASADTRHQANGQQMQEPSQIDPKFQGNTDESSNCIVKAAIYPPIGVMRVGNSKDDYFIGPLVPNPTPRCGEDAYRDSSGALKRQAAQFRIYGLNAAGKAIKELTMDECTEISWKAHLANQKSSWYQFNIALDVPEATDAPPSLLRNVNVPDRSDLLIDGGTQKLTAPNQQSGKFVGHFMGDEVYLGEMKTDDQGRLIMLGGHGKAANHNGDIAITFANNEGWHDDISDGPVTASVKYKGVALKVEPAWAICSPPDYAPLQKSVRTMWDLMRSISVKANMMPRPARPSFTHDILPIFERMHNLQWVNAGFSAAFGHGGPFNYTTPEWIAKLSNPSSAYIELRRTLSNNFRRYGQSGAEAAQLWPWLYGDAITIPPSGSERQHSTLSELQLSFLDQWVTGDFDADWGCPYSTPAQNIDDVPVEQQPEMLTRGAMEFCLADAFHPGCEMTWPMRTAGMYTAPFRLKHSNKGIHKDTTYYGPIINDDVITLAQGPLLGGQVAGSITRWMAVPWQTDTASCRDGYSSSYDPYLPTFWPARVPNNILQEQQYEQVQDKSLPEETRIQAFNYRVDWLDALPLYGQATSGYTAQINSMVANFGKLAVVQARPGVDGNPNFPVLMQVGITAKDHNNDCDLIVGAEVTEDGKQQTAAAIALRRIAGTVQPEPAGRSRIDLGVIEKVSRFRANFSDDFGKGK
ncbi:MAG: lysine-epsilon oxidase [Alteromonadaceae bacterium]|nr:MAG: lysine-epsilon oxidase [Alteromonadaceae bacterium]